MAEQHVQVMSPATTVEVASTGVTVVLGGGVDSDALAAHARDSTDVHGIADTAALVRTDDPRLSDAQPPSTHSLDLTTDSDTRLAMRPMERDKLAGVASGATANAPDAQLRDRGTHTGTQPATSIADLTEAVQDIVAAFIKAGAGTTVAYDDATGSLTITATATGGSTDPEVVRDVIGAAMVAGAGIQLTVDDAGDQITIAATGVLPTRRVTAGQGLTGGGDLSADRELAVFFGSTTGSVADGKALADLTARVDGMGDGRGVVSIADDDRDGIATITYTDGATSTLPLPAGPTGPKGDPGDPGPYILRGTGSPLGTVTPSAVGVTYTDNAATNGARVWISTGTTSSAWTVMNGNTGLRYLVNTVDAGVGKIDKVTIQRINNTVYVNFEGGSTMDALTLSTGEIAALPTGWRSSVTGVIATVHQDGSAVGQMIAYNGNSVRVITSAGAWRKGALIFPTTDPWPTSLPGTP